MLGEPLSRMIFFASLLFLVLGWIIGFAFLCVVAWLLLWVAYGVHVRFGTRSRTRV